MRALTGAGRSCSRLPSMTNQPIRWGILGTAQIARKNWHAISNTGDATVTAVASRDLARSRQFIRECQAARPMARVPDAYGSYEELLGAKNVDAVYIPLPTSVRKPWVIRAARAGKHVLCEKPCAVSAADLEEMLEACRQGGVQFMDGVMFDHSLRLPAMRKVLDDGASVGAIRRITSAFAFRGDGDFIEKNIRADGALEPLGCLGDLGWYCIRFTLWAMKWEMPRAVSARLIARTGAPGAKPVPLDLSAELLFGGGVSAGFSCSFTTALQQWAIVSGTAGQLVVRDFVLPSAGPELAFEVAGTKGLGDALNPSFVMESRRHGVAEHGECHATSQETRMIRDFGDQIRSGTLNTLWPEISLKTQRVADECYAAALSAPAPG
jgi:predicted dehydrogenase